MNSSVKSYILILVGAVIAIYANAEKEQNTFLLISGIVFLMLGVYSLSRGIPSSKKDDYTIEEEEE